MLPGGKMKRQNLLHIFLLLTFLGGCQSGGSGGSGVSNESSTPANEKEAIEYKKAILRCYKSGGTRVVKIEGNLRCF
jgi:hypothetical protein